MPSDLKRGDSHRAKGDETTPLLTNVEPTPIAGPVDSSHLPRENDDSFPEENDQDSEEVPLPKAQIVLLCYTAVVEPVAFFGIFPYITFMIERVGNVPKEEVGFYSGLIESLFSLTQMCVMIAWGRVCIRSTLMSSCLKLTASTGFRSLGKKACTRQLAGRYCNRNELIWNEPIPMADDRCQMFRWCLCWHCSNSSGDAQ